MVAGGTSPARHDISVKHFDAQERVALGQHAIGLSSTPKWVELDAELDLSSI
ncbi:hypothetical protein L195_g040957 [Trifolium pratense]|uniref:Uncharacterized protein n=1 Tax=Trifolium pratense TaxID=57577 RepID=A0A2K3M2C6_TRIPR|nr:hypothetical protein L195_g040957 [Trifolium pratense]